MKEKNIQAFFYASLAILLLVMGFNAFTSMELTSNLDAKISEAGKATEPPVIELTVIGSSCAECFDVSTIVDGVKGLDVTISKETILENGSEQAKLLINQHSLERLPAIIIEGETQKINLGDFRESANALVFDSVPAPYEDALTGEIMGRVTTIILEDNNCSLCNDLSIITENLKQSNILIADEKKVDYLSDEGKELISRHQITKVPVVLISDDLDAYPELSQGLQQSGLEAINGFYIIESNAPYVEIETGTTRGLVDAIFLDDENCEECYDVMIHKIILARMGVSLQSEETVDVNSARGQELISDLNITKIPTVILNGDVPAYPDFEKLWLADVGTKENESYVFRELEVLGPEIKFVELT